MIGMPEALLALGASLIAAGMTVWLTLATRAERRQNRKLTVARHPKLGEAADTTAQREAMLHDQLNATYILRPSRPDDLGLRTKAFVHPAE